MTWAGLSGGSLKENDGGPESVKRITLAAQAELDLPQADGRNREIPWRGIIQGKEDIDQLIIVSLSVSDDSFQPKDRFLMSLQVPLPLSSSSETPCSTFHPSLIWARSKRSPFRPGPTIPNWPERDGVR